MTKTILNSPPVNLVEAKLAQVGNYKFTGKVLGKGSFAVVREAVHVPLNVYVSVKVMDLTKCNTYMLKNHLREANILQSLNHPFVLTLFETMAYHNIYYVVTEIIQGGNLCDFVQQKKGKIDETTTRRFSRQIASALQYLHTRGIVHRDLKLENVMLDAGKRNVKLVDFGLTNTWSLDSPLKTLCGSPEYCAPELFLRGTKYGPEVDMWAFGVIMFALAAGKLPFPCLSNVLKTPEKRGQFIQIIYKGLSEANIKLIKHYSVDFIPLIKGLMNPRWEERLTINSIFRDPWITNKGHWVDVPHELLDTNDEENIIRQLSFKLKTTPERVKAELKLQPTGETAGYFNIMKLKEMLKRHKPMFTVKFDISQSNSFIESSFPKKHCSKQTLDGPKVSLLGNAMKLNEVILKDKYLQRRVLTPSSTTTNESSKGRADGLGREAKVVLPKIKSLNSNCSTPLSTLSSEKRTRNKLVKVNTALRKSLTIGNVILPSKLDVTPSAKSLFKQKQTSQKV